MNIRNLDLNLLKVLDAVLAERSVSKAAERLSLSQPAISNSLNRLRVALDDPLFTRTADGMAPTPRARELAEPVREALALISRCIAADAVFDFASAERTFVIAVEDYGEAILLPRLADRLAHVAPSVCVKVRPERGYKLRSEMREGDVDFAIDYFPLREDAFDNLPLMTDELVCIVRRDHPAADAPLTPERYAALRHVVLAQKDDRMAMVDRELAKLGLTRLRAVEAPHFLTMPLVVKESDHIGTLPRRLAAVFAAHFPIRVIEPPIAFRKIPIYLIWSRRLTDNAAHRWLREMMRELCGTL